MSYKQLYLEAQCRFAKKLELLHSRYNDIRVIVNNLTDSMDRRRCEISPELLFDLNKELGEITKICGDMIYNFEDCYNETN